MKKFISATLVALMLCVAFAANALNVNELPRTIDPGLQGRNHVQGVVVDLKNKCAYFSFTTLLLKTDLQGKPLGSVKGLTGHLGCLTFDKDNNRIYGSLEYKNDGIGKGILKRENQGEDAKNVRDAFYIAIFDLDKINRMDMDAEKDGVMKTVHLQEVVDDYLAKVNANGKTIDHRYGCSGIDGVTFAPLPGDKNGKKYLNVAYGIYGDTLRTDNDYQVILSYDIKDWGKYESPLTQGKPHANGPKKAAKRSFLFTGNTTYGIQNMCYDSETGDWFVAVYKGRKSQYPNYSLYLIDGSRKAEKQQLKGFYKPEKGDVIFLKEKGLKDEATGVRGFNFPYGATGIAPVGDGYFYISKNFKKDGQQGCELRLYKWLGKPDKAFERVK